MPRLFVAIDPDASVQERLAALKADLPTARWTKTTQMHLTLRFIGAEVADDLVGAIKAVLGKIEASAFELHVKGVGRFPTQKRKPPSVLWVGLDTPPELVALHAQVERALETVGFAPDTRDFSPHITLARFKSHKPLPQVEQFLKDHTDFEAGRTLVNQFVLYSSVLSSQGSSYRQEAVFPLG